MLLFRAACAMADREEAPVMDEVEENEEDEEMEEDGDAPEAEEEGAGDAAMGGRVDGLQPVWRCGPLV